MKRTLKNRVGRHLIPRLPVNRRTFDILRYELNAIIIGLRNSLNPVFHYKVRQLRKRKDLLVNFGSGGRGLSYWVNIELNRHDDTTLCFDIRRKLPFADESADGALAEHVMEHLDFRSDALAFAKEVHRILRPGGVFRVIVPDCERFCQAYASKSAKAWDELGWDLAALPSDIYTPMHILNHTFHQGGEHLFGYDFETLQLLLSSAGFSTVKRMSFKISIKKELEIDQSNHKKYSLYVDAMK